MAEGRAAVPSKNATVARKLQKILDVTLDDSFRDSLVYLSTFYNENTSKERKNLRGSLEEKVLKLHQGFLAEFAKINELYGAVEHDLELLCDECDKASHSLQNTQKEAIGLLSKASVLQSELSQIDEKERYIRAFLQKYQLTTEEKLFLKGDINYDFFRTLSKVQNIHKNCKELLNVNHQQAGIEIMEEMYMYQLQGFERLFKYTHKLCLDLMLTDTPEISQNFIIALNALKERPALWTQCMQEVGKGRRTTLVRGFYEVLQTGGAGARPIEVHSNDPVRFVGDMLAWVHQAAAEENELISHLFQHKATSVLASVQTDMVELTKSDVLNQIFEGLSKHVKGRIEPILSATKTRAAPESMVLLFKLDALLGFYSQAIPRILGSTASFSLLLLELKASSTRAFYDTLQSISEKLASSVPVVPADLTAPTLVTELLENLGVMMRAKETGMVAGASGGGEPGEGVSEGLAPAEKVGMEFEDILTAIVDPMIDFCIRVEGLDPQSKHLFLINSLYTIQATLSPFNFTKSKIDVLNPMVHAQLDALVTEQLGYLFHKVGFDDKLQAMAETPAETPLSTVGATNEQAMKDTMQAFYNYLYAIGTYVFPLSDRLVSLVMRGEASARVAEALSRAYDALYNAIHDPKNQYSDPAGIASQTPGRIKLLLNLDA